MRKVILTQNKIALVDSSDYLKVLGHTWHAYFDGNNWYALTNISVCNGKYRTVSMHRLLLGEPKNVKIDHVDGNGLNNRRKNLRFASDSHNQCNSRKRKNCTSRFKGVYWRKDRNCWQAQIGSQKNQTRRSLGFFTSERLAAATYDSAARKTYQRFARTNFST